MRSDEERIRDKFKAVDAIERGIADGRDCFYEDEFRQIFVAHQIQTIGEAAANISIGVRTKFRQVPWSEIVSMRNIIMHGYFQVDPIEVWKVAEKDIPPLKIEAANILQYLIDHK